MKRLALMLLGICLLLLSMIANDMEQSIAHADNRDHQIAIVIDDLGNNMKGTKEMIAMEAPLTLAIMPFLPTTNADAEAAYEAGHEVIVHMPMEPKKGNKKWLGPGAITSDLTDREIKQRLEAAIDNVPHAVGMNNHMGSKITSDERIMRIVLQVCKERNLYYLDSRTNYRSIAGKLAEEMGVPYTENILFLDDESNSAHIHRQMNQAIDLLKQRSNTVIIGHVGHAGDKTAAEIKHALPSLQQFGKMVHVSEIIKSKLIDPEVF